MGTTLPNTTGERLLLLRRRAHMTQSGVADAVGCTIKTYRSWEHGQKSPRNIDDVRALADLFGTSADFILCRSDFQTIDGAALHAVTGLSDDALRVLRACSSPSMSYHLGRDISRLIVDWGRHGSNSVVSQITRYTAINPGETGRVLPGDVLPGDGIAAASAVEVDLRALHWFGIAAACDRLRDDLTAE